MSNSEIYSVLCIIDGEVLYVRSYKKKEDAQKYVSKHKRFDELDGNSDLFSYEIHRTALFENLKSA